MRQHLARPPLARHKAQEYRLLSARRRDVVRRLAAAARRRSGSVSTLRIGQDKSTAYKPAAAVRARSATAPSDPCLAASWQRSWHCISSTLGVYGREYRLESSYS